MQASNRRLLRWLVLPTAFAIQTAAAANPESGDLHWLLEQRVRIQSPALGPGWHEGLFNRQRREPPCYVVVIWKPRPSPESSLQAETVIALSVVSELQAYSGPRTPVSAWAGRKSTEASDDSLWQLIPRGALDRNRDCSASPSSALADENTGRKITEAALRETRDIVSRELFGHYDLTNLAVLKIEDLRGRVRLGQDYGLVKVTLEFAAKRNNSKHPSLNPNMFEPGNAMCQGWLYLHCGVPLGHVFDGRLELLLAVDRDGLWKAVSPHWRWRRQYSLHGYLLLEGREKDGYVLFPKQQ